MSDPILGYLYLVKEMIDKCADELGYAAEKAEKLHKSLREQIDLMRRQEDV